MIYLHTLGDTLIKVGEKEIRPTSPMVFAALLYLGMERGRRVPRTALQELLFPNVDERSGAHSLRQLLYKLRHLGAPIEADAGGVRLRADQVCDDAAAESSLTNGHAADAKKYAIGFLPDYNPQLSERYQEWLDQRRASVTASIRRQLLSALSTSRDAVKWAAVERFATLVLEIDPLNEEATLALAEATALSGAKTKALAILTQYEHETGRADLRLPPSLLRKRISESVPDKNVRGLHTPFVGRDSDAEALRHLTALARRRHPSFVVVAGEAGIGKTRLLEETASLAGLEGMQVHVIRCQSHYASRPLSAFIELVPALLASRGALGVSPQSLAHLNYLTSHSDDRTDRPADARDDATRSAVLLSSLRDLVDAVAAETPLLIAVEDAHWADADSLRELKSLVQERTARALLVVYTTRYIETLRKAGLIDDATVVRRLKPLPSEPMNELARHLLPKGGGGEAGDVASWCVQTAAGNPLFLKMLCAHYGETGQPFSVPADLTSATTRRIEQLPQECRRILEFSALLGRHSTIDALRSLTECTQLQLLNSVQRLEEEGYLQIREDAVCISHDLLSECALNLVPPASRRVLHSCVAGELEKRYESTHDATALWDCAEQWALSGETEKALQFIKRCARHVAQLGRATQALSLLDRAKQLATFPMQAAGILGEMMITAKAAGQWSDVARISKELALLPIEAAGIPSHTPIELLAIEAEWTMRLGRANFSRLLTCARAKDASSTHRIEAALLLLRMAHEWGETDLAATVYAAVSPLLLDDTTNYANRILPIIYHTSFGDRELALALTRKLVSELDSLESLGDQLRAASNASKALSFLGAFDESIAVIRDYYGRTKDLGLQVWYLAFCCDACATYSNAERFEEEEAWFARLEVPSDHSPDAVLGRIYHSHGFDIAIRKRDPLDARKHLDGLAKSVAVTQTLRSRAYLYGSEVRLLQLDPGFSCDDSTIAELFALYDATKHLLSADGLALALAEALARRGKREELRALLDDYFHRARREPSPMPLSFARLVAFSAA